MVLAVEMNSRLFLTSRITVDVLHPIIAAISRKLLWNAKTFSITHLLVKLRCWNFMVPLFRHFGHLNYTTFHADIIATFWYCQYSFTHFTQKFWATVQWNKYPRSAAKWIFIPLCQPPFCLSYQSNICGASQPEALLLSTSISGGYSNSSCSSARSLFSAALSCNTYFFCRGCKTVRSSFV